jgi:hypothetical protein
MREEQSSLVALPHPLYRVGLRQGYYADGGLYVADQKVTA